MNNLLEDNRDFEATKSEVVNLLKSIANEDNTQNLYDHLQKMFNTKLALQNDDQFLDMFEDISYRIKKEGFYTQPDDKEARIKNYLEYFVKACQGNKTLLEPLVKKDGDDITPITNVGFVPDYYSIFQSLEWCGISISDKESYLLTNSIRKHLSDKGIQSATFWGKIFGKDKDYYIIETPPTEVVNQGIYLNLII
jgi:hypothetical protein